MRCMDCKFWWFDHPGHPDTRDSRKDWPGALGDCHRHAPVIVQVIYMDRPAGAKMYPETRGGDGCGDFEPYQKESI